MKKDDSSVCEFSYAAMGGTNEDWKLRINKLADGRLVCVVERYDIVLVLTR